MKYLPMLGLLTATLIMPEVSLAQDKQEIFDPAARAKIIAPFISEQSIAVFHIDFSRIDFDVLRDHLGQLFPDDKDDISAQLAELKQSVNFFLRSGGMDVYLVLKMIPFGGQGPENLMFVVIPLKNQEKEAAIRESELLRGLAFKRSGDVLIAADEKFLKTMNIAPDPRPELAAAFTAAGDTAAQALLLPPKYFRRVIEETMPQLPDQIGGGPSKALTQGCLWAALGAELSPQPTLRLVIQSENAPAAEALRKELSQISQHLAKIPFVKELAPNLSKATALLMPSVDGDKLVLTLNQQKKDINIIIDSIAPLLEEARDNARQATSRNNLKQIGLAMHNYHDANREFPAAAIYSKDGKPLLSWRVALLPMMEQNKLYEQFHLDEPWDSPNNRKLIDKMPPVFRSPKSKLKEQGKTNYVVPVGPGTAFGNPEGTQIKEILDGSAHTVMAVEVDDAHAVIWTKPDDLPYDPNKPAKGLGGMYKNVFIALFCDGAVLAITLSRPDDELRSIFSINGGEPVPAY
jgi:hypothetical protein